MNGWRRTVTVIVAIIGTLGLLGYWAFGSLDTDMRELRTDVGRMDTRLDSIDQRLVRVEECAGFIYTRLSGIEGRLELSPLVGRL